MMETSEGFAQETETKISKDDFDSYVRVQKSGVTNMFAVSTVAGLSGLTKDQCFDIMKNYEKYAEEYKDGNE